LAHPSDADRSGVDFLSLSRDDSLLPSSSPMCDNLEEAELFALPYPWLHCEIYACSSEEYTVIRNAQKDRQKKREQEVRAMIEERSKPIPAEKRVQYIENFCKLTGIKSSEMCKHFGKSRLRLDK